MVESTADAFFATVQRSSAPITIGESTVIVEYLPLLDSTSQYLEKNYEVLLEMLERNRFLYIRKVIDKDICLSAQKKFFDEFSTVSLVDTFPNVLIDMCTGTDLLQSKITTNNKKMGEVLQETPCS